MADEPTRELVLQTPPATGISSVAVSRDGSLVASGAGDGGIRIYDARTGRLLRALGEMSNRDVSFSPDGRQITAAGFHMDKLVPIFNVQTGNRVQALPGHTEWETDATAISPDGKLLASTGADKQILIWELPSGRLRHQLSGQPDRSAALAFSPDSTIVATGGGDRTIQLWSTKTGKSIRSLAGHGDWVCSLAFSPDGKKMISGSCDWGFHRGHDWPRPAERGAERCEWRLWDVDSGNCLREGTDSGSMFAVAYAPDGKTFAIAVANVLWVYDLARIDSPTSLVTHDGAMTSVAYTPDGASIVTGSFDHTIKRTNLSSGKTEWHAPGSYQQVNCVALSDDASTLVTGSSDARFLRGRKTASAREIGPGSVRIWDFATGRLQRTLGDPTTQILAVAISANGKQVFSGGATRQETGIVQVWDAATGAPLWAADDSQREVLAVAVSRDGKLLASGDAEGIVKIRDAATGAVLQTMTGHRRGATSLVFSPDASALYCGEGFGGTRIWEVSSGQRRIYCEPADTRADSFHDDRLLSSIGLSQDGRLLATCTSSSNDEFTDPVRLWNPQDGSLIRVFAAEGIHGRPMALSPDGTIIATGGKSVKLWDVRTGTMLRELQGILKRTQSIVFSADGQSIVSGGSYGSTNIWDVGTGKLRLTLFSFPTENDGSASDTWLAYEPSGALIGSEGIEQYVAWRQGDEFLTAIKKPSK